MTEGIPSLESVGVEAVDGNVCEDTFENRRLLREAKLRWRLVPGENPGMPSGLLEVHLADQLEEVQELAYQRFRPILVDPTDPWSDYEDPRSWPHDLVGIPYWVYRLVDRHAEWEEKDRLPGSKRKHEPHLPTRCVKIKTDGTRCWMFSLDKANEGRCRNHAPGKHVEFNQGYQIAARAKVMQSMPAMVDELEGIALADPEKGLIPPAVKLKAITEMMDRGGIRGGTEVDLSGHLEVEGKDASEEIRERLGSLAEKLERAESARKAIEAARDAEPDDVHDAIVVEDGETA